MSKRAFRSSSNGLRVANEDDLRIAELVMTHPWPWNGKPFPYPNPNQWGSEYRTRFANQSRGRTKGFLLARCSLFCCLGLSEVNRLTPRHPAFWPRQEIGSPR